MAIFLLRRATFVHGYAATSYKKTHKHNNINRIPIHAGAIGKNGDCPNPKYILAFEGTVPIFPLISPQLSKR